VVTAEDGRAALAMLLNGEKRFHAMPADPLTPAEDPPEGSNVMEYEHQFHIIFLDNQMPRLSGVEMTKRLRAYGRKCVISYWLVLLEKCDANRNLNFLIRDIVVGVTGNALAEDQREYLDAGAD